MIQANGKSESTLRAFRTLREKLVANRNSDGFWTGRLSSSALSTATTVSAYSFYLESQELGNALELDLMTQISACISWLIAQQNEDGGWGDTDKSYSNISTTMLVVAALSAAGRACEFKSEISRAQSYIDSQGGIPGLRARYGIDKTFAVPILANCAMAGMVDWKEVSALPFEAACVPQRFYNVMQLPVVSYAIPALVAIGQAKFVNDPPWDPFRKLIRKASIKRSLAVLEKMQPLTGGFLEAAPLTGFVCMGLIKSGRGDHPVVKNGIEFLLNSFRPETINGKEVGGSLPIDTNLSTWVTTLSLNAIAASDQLDGSAVDWLPTLNWILSCQNTDVHPFTGAAPGGWGWSDLSGAVPDADDTPGALLALKNLERLADFDDSARQRIKASARQGIEWLINLQNRDKGWPTFCRGWGKLPFDRSGSDITAHAMRALIVWKNEFDSPRLNKAIKNGYVFLARNQQNNGSWLPLWFGNQNRPDDVNPYYGTAKVLAVFRDQKSFDTLEALNGLNYLVRQQNEDGGWGGGASSHWNEPSLGSSSVEETALCTEVLLADEAPESQASAARGIEWLVKSVEANLVEQSSPIGFYFAKLWYYEQLYPLIFATHALATAVKNQSEHRGSKIGS